ncbi:MAG: hypothetical protein C3F13_17875 [Anaerolineales bacterium]|nr:MAG: hypothetical protein C3F13_17875 [Anaerolineales bacterium]
MNTKSTSRPSVPVLITWDVDPDPWMPFDRRQKALWVTLDMCQRYSIPATFYFTAQPAHEYAEDFMKMRALGHEIGCHGFTHGDEENYNRMPEGLQRDYICRATDALLSVLDEPVRSFRSPRVKTSSQTLKLLAEQGYWSDSSVCSQRMDLVSSNLINFGWLGAPRRPYYPHQSSAFRRGNVPILEIPVSALIAPFISSMLYAAGLSSMKRFFRILYAEARRTGKPIVYLAHPIEFAPMGKGKALEPLQRKYFSPSYIRANGLRLRNLLKSDRHRHLAHTEELLAYMASFPDVVFMTASDYTKKSVMIADGNTMEANDQTTGFHRHVLDFDAGESRPDAASQFDLSG